jgi:hypothetical protein
MASAENAVASCPEVGADRPVPMSDETRFYEEELDRLKIELQAEKATVQALVALTLREQSEQEQADGKGRE